VLAGPYERAGPIGSAVGSCSTHRLARSARSLGVMGQHDAARAMHSKDASAEVFGIELVEAGPQRAVARMTVQPAMCNGFKILHGGMTFLLADSAMAFASNADNEMALASSAEIDWLAPVEIGQVLTATATQSWSSGRSALWDIVVSAAPDHDAEGTVVALIRGRTRRVGRPVIENL
jgi:acyl-CoA thioesterase